MIAIYSIVGKVPVINHAVARRHVTSLERQLDWLFISPQELHEFIEASNNYPILEYTLKLLRFEPNKKRIKGSCIYLFKTRGRYVYLFRNKSKIIKGLVSDYELKDILEQCITRKGFSLRSKLSLNAVDQAKILSYILSKSNLTLDFGKLTRLFDKALTTHKQKIIFSKNGLSPTFFMKQPPGAFYKKLFDFYLYLGKFIPGYRNYLFRTQRNKESIDIITSSLNLPPSITTLGRFGCYSDVLSMFGLHIFLKNEYTELVFMPNKLWVKKLNHVVQIMNLWIRNIYLIYSKHN